MNIGEKTAYLKGLADGLEISSDSKNGKIIKGILDILEDVGELEHYIKEIDDDLAALEEFVFDEEDFEDDEEDDEFEFDGSDEFDGEKESAENELLDGVFELKCPFCKELVMIATNDILNSDNMAVECPECGEEIEIIDEDAGGSPCAGCSGHGI